MVTFNRIGICCVLILTGCQTSNQPTPNLTSSDVGIQKTEPIVLEKRGPAPHVNFKGEAQRNVALLLTSHLRLVAHRDSFDSDLKTLAKILADTRGHFGFFTRIDLNLKLPQSLMAIGEAAQLTSDDGTLFVVMVMHGATPALKPAMSQKTRPNKIKSKKIKASDSKTLNQTDPISNIQFDLSTGFEPVFSAIKSARKNIPVRRLVLYLTTSDNDHWMQTITHDAKLADELIVVSATGLAETKDIERATRGILTGFDDLALDESVNFERLVEFQKKRAPSLSIVKIPDDAWSDSLKGLTPADTKPIPEDAPRLYNIVTAATKQVTVVAKNDSRGGVQLWFYSRTPLAQLQIQTATGWWTVPDVYDSQPDFPSIFGSWSDISWANEYTVDVKCKTQDGSVWQEQLIINQN